MNSASHDDLTSIFSVHDETVDDVTQVVAVAGEVDLYSAPELKEHILTAIEGGKTRIVVDLTDANEVVMAMQQELGVW